MSESKNYITKYESMRNTLSKVLALKNTIKFINLKENKNMHI